MLFALAVLAMAPQDDEHKPLKGHHLKLMHAIVAKNFSALKPYVRGNVRIQHVGNCYKDHNNVFAQRFSNAQLERTWHVEIMSANLNSKTSPRTASELLKEFSRDIGDQTWDPRDVWYPSTFDYKGNKGIMSKIASGAYYFVELDTLIKKPRIVRLWDLDHAKDWEDAWKNRESD